MSSVGCSAGRGALLVVIPGRVVGCGRVDRSCGTRLVVVSGGCFSAQSGFCGVVSLLVPLGGRPYIGLGVTRASLLGACRMLLCGGVDRRGGLFHSFAVRCLVRTAFCRMYRLLLGRLRVGGGGLPRGRSVFGRFLGLMRARRCGRESVSFCTRGLYLAPGCLSSVVQSIDKRLTKG